MTTVQPLFSSLLVTAVALIAGVGPLMAQEELTDADSALARVQLGLETTDANNALADAGDRVEVVLFGEGGVYRRGQAISVLEDFFRRFPPDSVSFSEHSTIDDSRSVIGQYYTRDGSSPLIIRVRHRVEPADSLWELIGIRVDRPSLFRTGSR